MYHILPGAALGSTVLGSRFVANGHSAARGVARAILPLTGFAFGLYVAIALGLLVTGSAMRITAARRDRRA